MKSFLVGLKNVLLWSFGRGTWQYDALCLLIVMTVFLVPSHYFGDRDREEQKKESAIWSASTGDETYVGADELDVFLKTQNRPELTQTPKEAIRLYLQERFGKNVAIETLDLFTSPDGKVIYKVRLK